MNRRAFVTAALATPILLGDTEPGFTSLFDGATLGGWSVQEGPPPAFKVEDGAIVIDQGSGYPAWLRSEKRYENFDFRCRFCVQGWSDSGIYIHAPEHGRNTWTGMQIKIFQQLDKEPRSNSMGSIFPLIAPKLVNVKNNKAWNTLRILMDWPSLRVWSNDEMVQDVNVAQIPELRHRLRNGYIGISSLSYPLRFRDLRIRELPSREKWEPLFDRDEDFAAKWYVSEKEPRFVARGGVLRGDGAGHIATKAAFKDFELHLYVRACHEHNSGVLFHSDGKGLAARHYEIQLHNVEDAHYPTGSLYTFKRSIYPKIEDEKWYLMQLIVQGKNALVRINGEDVMEYGNLDNLDEGHIELQAHRPGYWTEFKQIRIKRI